MLVFGQHTCYCVVVCKDIANPARTNSIFIDKQIAAKTHHFHKYDQTWHFQIKVLNESENDQEMPHSKAIRY